MGRGPRRTAREIANLQPRFGWFGLVLIAIGLAVILTFKFVISDKSSEVFRSVVGNPELELPSSATDKAAKERTAPPRNQRLRESEAQDVETQLGTSKRDRVTPNTPGKDR